MINRYYDIFLQTIEGSKKLMQSYNQTNYWLNEFKKDCGVNLNFKTVDTRFYNEFWKYFVEGKGYAPNTFGKHIKHIKAFMRWAHEEGLHNSRDWRKFKITNQACDEDCLSSEDIKKIWDLGLDFDEVINYIENTSKIRLDHRQKRDRFRNIHKHFHCIVALYSSGMYPNDLIRFKKENIIDSRYVKYKRSKNVNSFREPWCIFPYVDDDLFHFKAACEEMKYNFDFEIGNLARDIKVILGLAEINKSITARSFRKTFASIWYFERGLDLQNAMKMTGHAKESSFRHYLNIDDEVVINKILERKPMVKAGFKPKLRKAI